MIRKGQDKFSHKTRRLSIRIYYTKNNKQSFIDFYETISVKVAKLKYIEIIARLKI